MDTMQRMMDIRNECSVSFRQNNNRGGCNKPDSGNTAANNAAQQFEPVTATPQEYAFVVQSLRFFDCTKWQIEGQFPKFAFTFVKGQKFAIPRNSMFGIGSSLYVS